MSLEVTVLRDQGDAETGSAPGDEAFERWVAAATGDRSAAVTIRLVDAAESRRLNHEYRGKDRPTNVLSFASDLPAEVTGALEITPLGDLVICAPQVVDEARYQGKPTLDHWAHLTLHGVLHLLGHDHEDDREAQAMEALEVKLLADLGVADPYGGEP